MAFDNRDNRTAIQIPPSPDFVANLAAYEDQVKEISVTIKSAQSELHDINDQIVVAKTQLEAGYVAKIDAYEVQIKSHSENVQMLMRRQTELESAIQIQQQKHDGIVVDFSEKQKVIDATWMDFHQHAGELLAQQKQLKYDQDNLATGRAQLIVDQSTFETYKTQQMIQIEEELSTAAKVTDDAHVRMAAANSQSVLAEEAGAAVTSAQAFLDAKIIAAQTLLAQADAVASQQAKNDSDQGINSANAVQNQLDANQIRVAKVALNNQQQEYNSRMLALQQAEAAIKGGS